MKTNINLFDHTNGVFVKITRSAKHWERYISKNKRKWTLTHKSLTLEDVLKFKEEVINNNYRNLYRIIARK